MLPYLCAPHWGLVNFPFDFSIDLLKLAVIKTNCSSKLVFFAGLQVPIKKAAMLGNEWRSPGGQSWQQEVPGDACTAV